MRIMNKETVGLIVDLQIRLLPHMVRSETLIGKCITLIKGLKLLEVPIIYTEQYPKGLGCTDERIQKLLTPMQAIEKIAFSCCGEPAMIDLLQTFKRKTVLVAGIETHVCILQTVLDLIDAGYAPVIVEDCVGSRSENDKNIALNRIRGSGGCITTVESLLFEVMGTAKHPQFKEVTKLVK